MYRFEMQVRNLADYVDSDDIRRVFQEFGQVHKCVVQDNVGYVCMLSVFEGLMALDAMDDTWIDDNHQIEIEPLLPVPQVKTTRFFVGQLSRRVKETRLWRLFSPYGEVLEIKMLRNFAFAYVILKVPAEEVVRELNGLTVICKRIIVEVSTGNYLERPCMNPMRWCYICKSLRHLTVFCPYADESITKPKGALWRCFRNNFPPLNSRPTRNYGTFQLDEACADVSFLSQPRPSVEPWHVTYEFQQAYKACANSDLEEEVLETHCFDTYDPRNEIIPGNFPFWVEYEPQPDRPQIYPKFALRDIPSSRAELSIARACGKYWSIHFTGNRPPLPLYPPWVNVFPRQVDEACADLSVLNQPLTCEELWQVTYGSQQSYEEWANSDLEEEDLESYCSDSYDPSEESIPVNFPFRAEYEPQPGRPQIYPKFSLRDIPSSRAELTIVARGKYWSIHFTGNRPPLPLYPPWVNVFPSQVDEACADLSVLSQPLTSEESRQDTYGSEQSYEECAYSDLEEEDLESYCSDSYDPSEESLPVNFPFRPEYESHPGRPQIFPKFSLRDIPSSRAELTIVARGKYCSIHFTGYRPPLPLYPPWVNVFPRRLRY